MVEKVPEQGQTGKRYVGCVKTALLGKPDLGNLTSL